MKIKKITILITIIATVILVGCSSYKNSDKVELLSEKNHLMGNLFLPVFHVKEEVLLDTSISMRIYVE